MTGICGSDTKQILMDFGDGDPTDNAMTALISFPHVLGHEVIGEVSAVGSDVTRLQVGQRVVLNPWLSCAPRGISPVCPACEAGDLNLCWNFGEGRLAPGIHSGNSKDAPGGFAEYLPAHESMLFPVPDSVPDEVAVLADPFSVSLHAITRTPPPPGGKAVIYGAGALGTTALAILRALYPDVDVLVVARWEAQKQLAESMGATVIAHEPDEAVVEQIAAWSGAVLRTPWVGLPFAHPGHVDVVYDTIGVPKTVEIGVRVLAARGALVELGVNPPGRFEWTPLYFKEVRLVGSNAFAIETVRGVRQHAIQHYLDMVADGTIDLSGMLTHTFRLAEWRDAFAAIADQGTSGAIKVAFDFR
ncbi:MAG: alcohol dehydrogenase catalytic domain-containing protein [Actinobacteria bacterium]|nr:alcohol dehydrogenase catalytic domain-containing protein [Actinomycetota bacterium]